MATLYYLQVSSSFSQIALLIYCCIRIFMKKWISLPQLHYLHYLLYLRYLRWSVLNGLERYHSLHFWLACWLNILLSEVDIEKTVSITMPTFALWKYLVNYIYKKSSIFEECFFFHLIYHKCGVTFISILMLSVLPESGLF